ncbi:MAG: glycosyltransferase, partial [Rubrivivax sp.]
MKFSIVTVSYNSAATIADTLRSVSSQTHADIEHLIIDGGSTDDTLAVVRREGAHVARLVSEPDRGIYDAMNKGIALAGGDLIGFLNADDMLASPRAVADMAAAAEGA